MATLRHANHRGPFGRMEELMGGKGSGRKVGPCGTAGKYQWHWKRGESCELCKQAAAAYAREKYAKKRKKLGKPVGTIKSGPKPTGTKKGRNKELVRAEKLRRGQCADCGIVINERTIVFIDFDHRDPTDKSFTISYEMHKVHASDLIAEMAKCDAVCRNCHALRTHDQKHHLFRRVTVSAPTLFDCDGLHG